MTYFSENIDFYGQNVKNVYRFLTILLNLLAACSAELVLAIMWPAGVIV